MKTETVFKYDKYLKNPPDIRVLLQKDVVETDMEVFNKDEMIVDVLHKTPEIKSVTLNIIHGAHYELAWLYDLQDRVKESQ